MRWSFLVISSPEVFSLVLKPKFENSVWLCFVFVCCHRLFLLPLNVCSAVNQHTWLLEAGEETTKLHSLQKETWIPMSGKIVSLHVCVYAQVKYISMWGGNCVDIYCISYLTIITNMSKVGKSFFSTFMVLVHSFQRSSLWLIGFNAKR